MRGKKRASSSMRSCSAQLLGPGENDGASMASRSPGGGSRVVTPFCPFYPLDAGEQPAEGVPTFTALERTLCSDIFFVSARSSNVQRELRAHNLLERCHGGTRWAHGYDV